MTSEVNDLESVVTITLAPCDGGTEVTLRHANPGRELAPLVFAGHCSCIVAEGDATCQT